MVEIYFNIQSDNGALTENHALRKWSNKYICSLEDAKDVRAGMKLNSLMTSAGLVDVESRMIPLPLSGWPSGELLASLVLQFPLLIFARTENERNRNAEPRKYSEVAELPGDISVPAETAYVP